MRPALGAAPTARAVTPAAVDELRHEDQAEQRKSEDGRRRRPAATRPARRDVRSPVGGRMASAHATTTSRTATITNAAMAARKSPAEANDVVAHCRRVGRHDQGSASTPNWANGASSAMNSRPNAAVQSATLRPEVIGGRADSQPQSIGCSFFSFPSTSRRASSGSGWIVGSAISSGP